MSDPNSIRDFVTSEDYGDRLIGLNRLDDMELASAYELLDAAMTDDNPRVRYTAASKMVGLGHHDRERSLSLLRDRIRTDSELDVRAAAADAIGALKLNEAFDDLAQLYESTTDWIVRLSVVAALGEMQESRGFDILKDALETGEDLVKTIAIGAMGELGDDRAASLVVPFADSGDPQMRFRVARALGNLSGEGVTPALEKLAKDEVEIVAAEAQRHL